MTLDCHQLLRLTYCPERYLAGEDASLEFCRLPCASFGIAERHNLAKDQYRATCVSVFINSELVGPEGSLYAVSTDKGVIR